MNLLDGSRITKNGTITYDQTPFGPMMNCGVAGWGSINTTWADGGGNPQTFAAIYMPTSSSASSGLIFSCRNDNVNPVGKIGVSGLQFYFNTQGSSNFSGIFLTIGRVYFLVASCRSNNQNYLVLDLTTGQIFTAANVAAMTMDGDNVGTAGIGGEFTSARACAGKLAAVMFSHGVYLKLSEMIKWAEDPWSFWYPVDQDYVSPISMLVGSP